MIGFENHISRGVEIRDRLARVLADDADADFNARGQAYQWQAEADRRIAEWMRSPGQAVTAADVLCQEALENDRAIEQQRADRHEARKALREATDARPAPDPTITIIHLRDAVSGRLFAVTMPTEQVELVVTNRLTM